MVRNSQGVNNSNLSLLLSSDHNSKSGGSSKETLPAKGANYLKSKSKSLLAAVTHPKEATKAHIQTRISSKVSAFNSDPFHLRENDVEFVKAQEARDEAQNFDEFQKHNARLDELLDARKKYLVAWATKRHLRCVSVVKNTTRPWPDMKDFRTKNIDGKENNFDCLAWLGQFLLFISQTFTPRYISPWDDVPPVNQVELRSNLERLLIGTGPWQEWAMNVRRVYRWERPHETLRWLALYLVLWYYQYLITFIYLYIIYYVLKKRYRPTTVQDIRESVSRAQSMGEHAYRLAEAIEKHGHDMLLENLWGEYGSMAQLQLGDFADLLEVARNFYEWRHPQNTAYTLVFFSICAAMGILTDMTHCVKTATFIFGLGFFFYFPISSRYPKYRYVASPLKWVLWGIPTHIEFACQELRKEAMAKRETIISEGRGHINIFDDYSSSDDMDYCEDSDDCDDQNGDEDQFYETTEFPDKVGDASTGIVDAIKSVGTLVPNSRSDVDVCSSFEATSVISGESNRQNNEDGHNNLIRNKISMFHCQIQGHLGLLYLTLDGLVFETKVRRKIMLKRRWDEIRFLRKENAVSLGPVSTPDSIVIGFQSKQLPESPGDDELRIHIYHRNEAFNRIIGFSGLQFTTC